MKRLWILFFLVVLSNLVLADVVINEIMYDPEGNEYDNEYIELYNSGSFQVDLFGWTLSDSGSDTETLIGFNSSSTVLLPDNYAIITAEDNTVEVFNQSIRLTTQDNSICSYGLSNSGETIILKNDSGNVIDAITYSDEWGAEGQNKSLCKLPNGNGLWDECERTPGKNNEINFDSNCDWSVQVILNGTVFEDPEFKVKVLKINGDGKANLSVDKWIEDSFENLEKTYSLWNAENVLNYKTSSEYSPSLTQGDAYFIKANITNVSCIDTNLSNNFVSEMIFVASEEHGTNPDSYIEIIDVPDSAEFGDVSKSKIKCL